ncbi:hypothetical protein ACFE04_020740 [Oxalis oulophora]
MLQLILDILQRKDTHEIFAEPVDSKEVEDYYEIIKEPMNFGTMRAKLHEGMYKTLEQFKRDVLLISRNAMQFNSPSTIFFRQARAIHELAIKVFHALKTDPKNLEFEFSEAKRRSSRRPFVGDKGPTYSLSTKRPGTNLRSNTTLTLQLKATPPNLQKIIPRDLSRHKVPSDKRSSFRAASFTGDLPKSLMHVKQHDFSYGESLLWFVKDLGPTAEMVAQRKLNGTVSGRSQTGECSTHQAEVLDKKRDYEASYINFPLTESRGNVKEPIVMMSNKIKSNDSEEQLPMTAYEHEISHNSLWVYDMQIDLIEAKRLSSHNLQAGNEGWSYGFDNPSEGAASKTLMSVTTLSPFVFDLPYLKNRLDQINCGHDTSQKDKMTCTQTQPSLDVQPTDGLALQL